MNPVLRLGLWLAGEKKSRTTAETLPTWQLGKPYYPPTPVLTTREAIRDGLTQAGVVYACIRLIANTATSVPLRVYKRRGEEWEYEPHHPLQELLNTPNSRLTRRRIYYRAVQHLQLTGNAIFTKIRVPKSGPPTQLWPINPDLMRPIPSSRDFIEAWEMTIGGQRYRLKAEDVIHLQLENPETPWWGIGPLQAAMLDVGMYVGNKRWNLRTVERGAVTPGVLEIPEDISTEQYEAIRAQLDNRSFGEDDAGRELILGSGMKYHRMSLTGEELGFLESMRFGREEISMIFGVPAPLLTPENATLANVDAYDSQFWANAIVPLNTSIADMLTHSLAPEYAPPGDLVIEHDYSNVPAMQENVSTQSETAERFVRTGFTPAGVNRLLDLGFEDDEITSEPEAVESEREELAHPGPTRRKADDELRRSWKATEDERQQWEVEVAKRLNTTIQNERDKAVKAWVSSNGDLGTLTNAVTTNRSAWTSTLAAVYITAGRHFAQREYDKLTPKARKAFDPLQIAIEWAEANAAAKVVGISETTIEVLARIISAGLTPGDDGFSRTITQLAADISDTYDSWVFTDLGPNLTIEQRAMMIARTETGFAMNYGHQVGAEQAATEFNLDLVKVWASSGDDRVRDSHMIHGEQAEMDAWFSNGLRYPNDPDAPAAEVVNCRCTVAHRVRRPS